MKTTLNNLGSLKYKIASSGDKKEVISAKYASEAMENVKRMQLKTADDFFLYFSSLNLLNAYIKQTKPKQYNYKFKNYVTRGIEKLLKSKAENVTFCDNTKDNTVIVNVCGMQFSYHFVFVSQELKQAKKSGNRFYKYEDWHGLRLQPAAVTVYNFARNLEGLSGNAPEKEQTNFDKD